MGQVTSAEGMADRPAEFIGKPGKKELRGVGGMAFTELWERFSFYGIQSILAFYLFYEVSQGGLGLTPAIAAGITGAYGGAVYLSQLLGAWAGERLLSPKRLVFWGGVVITLGHLALAFMPGIVGLTVGLILIVFGTGALKTNITSIVGFILEDDSAAGKDVGFSYFYIAINAGAVLGPFVTGLAQNSWGFHVGFGLAAAGMVGALAQYVYSQRFLPARADAVIRPLSAREGIRVVYTMFLAVLVILAVVFTGLIHVGNLAMVVTVGIILAAIIFFTLILRSSATTSQERSRVRWYIPLFIASSLFFGLLLAEFTAVPIFVAERVDLNIGQWHFPIGWVTMIASIAGLIMLPLAASIWKRRGSKQPHAGTKFAIGLGVLAIGFIYMFVIATFSSGSLIPFLLIVPFIILVGGSEAFVGPIGLSLSTQIAPRAFAGQMVAINFLTLALGSSLAGIFGQYYTVVSNSTYFAVLGGGAALVALAILIFRKRIHAGLYAGIEG